MMRLAIYSPTARVATMAITAKMSSPPMSRHQVAEQVDRRHDDDNPDDDESRHREH